MISKNCFIKYKKLCVTALYIFVALFVYSCRKDIEAIPAKSYDPTVGVVSQLKDDQAFMPGKYIFFQVLQQPDAIDSAASVSINVFGKFSSDITGTPVNAGNILIDHSLAITSGPGNVYQYTYDQNSLSKGKASMGHYIDVQVEGSNAVEPLTRKLYVPGPIFLTGLYKSVSTISNNKSYHVSWNADPQNMFGKVLIQVDYYAGLSVYHNAANPASVKSLVYVTADNGNFIIPATDLQRFPVSSYVSISISRATDNSWPTAKGTIEYIAVSSSLSSPILVEN